MTDRLAIDHAAALEIAFARIVSLAAWVSRQRDEFTFADVAGALGDAYAGSHNAVDRMWTRDKYALEALGLRVECTGGTHYVFERTRRRPGLDGHRAASLAAVVRSLPRGDAALETALRKLLAHGAPILGALMARDARDGRSVSRDTVARRLSVAHLLLVLLHAAGEDGLSVEEAVVGSGARDRQDLEAVLTLLGAVRLPLDGVEDSVPVFLEGDRVELYALFEVLPLPAFTEAELAALESVGIGMGAHRNPVVDI